METTHNIKPLEWKPHPFFPNSGNMVADAPKFGYTSERYYVGKSDEISTAYKAYLAPEFGSWYWVSDGHENIEDAKKACEEHNKTQCNSFIDMVIQTSKERQITTICETPNYDFYRKIHERIARDET